MAVQAGGDTGLDVAADLPPASTHARRQPFTGWRRVALGLVLPALLVTVWSVAAATGLLSTRLLPAPADIVTSARDLSRGRW